MLTGTVTYIVFDEGVIVLGTNICCHKQNNDKEIWTTITQCVLEDNFNVQADGNVITNGSFLYKIWILNGNWNTHTPKLQEAGEETTKIYRRKLLRWMCLKLG